MPLGSQARGGRGVERVGSISYIHRTHHDLDHVARLNRLDHLDAMYGLNIFWVGSVSHISNPGSTCYIMANHTVPTRQHDLGRADHFKQGSAEPEWHRSCSSPIGI